MNNLKIHALFDLGATHLFISTRVVSNMGKEINRVEKGFIIGTPLSDVLETNIVYVSVKLSLNRYELEVDFIPLEFNDFNIILGIDWLSKHKA
jgi:hypothetical protein